MRIIIETDLEPDDIMFIGNFLDRARTKSCSFDDTDDIAFVVGEGHDTRLKVVILKELLATLPVSSTRKIRIIQGLPSSTLERPYPTKNLPQEWLTRVQDEPYFSEEEVLAKYKELYDYMSPHVVYMLKPPREAMFLMSKINTSTTVCHSYGGYNYKVLGGSIDWVNSLARQFKEFRYYSRKMHLPTRSQRCREAFYVGVTDEFQTFVRMLAVNWNEQYDRLVLNISEPKTRDDIVAADVLCLYPAKETVRGYLVDEDSIRLDPKGPVMTGVVSF
jgi:hypothetical protein